MPSLSEPFTIADLPKITLKKSADIPISIEDSSDGIVHVGISHGSVSTYQLRPTPKVISIYSVSPGTIFTALASNNSKSLMRISYAYIERKNNYLKIAQPLDHSEDKKSSSQDMVVETTENGGEITKLNFSECGNYIYAVFKNASIGCYDVQNFTSTPFWSLKGKSSRVLIYSTFFRATPSNRHYLNGSIRDDEDFPDQIALLVSKREVGKKSSFEVRLVSFEPENGRELLNIEIDIRRGGDDEVDHSIFSYSEGFLYRFNGHEVEKYALLTGNLLSSAPLSSEPAVSTTSASKYSMVATGNGKVVVSNSNGVHLVDTTYGALLSTVPIDISGTTNLLGYVDKETSVILAVSSFNAGTFTLSGLSLSSGKGTLLEAMDHGVDKSSSQWRYGFSDLLIKKNSSLRDYTAYLANTMLSSQQLNRKILRELREYKASIKVKNFEKIVLYLQGTEWSEITEQDISVMLASEDNIPVYDADQDREVDKDLIFGITKLILEPENAELKGEEEESSEDDDDDDDEEYTGQLTVSLDRNFIPEFALNYILTHPLFPTSQISNLFDALAPYPRLLRQAIVTTQSVTCTQLIQYLNQPDEEIFADIVSRVTSEFSLAQITEAVSNEYLSTNRHRSSVDGKEVSGPSRVNNIVTCVRRLIKLDIGWSLIPALMDAGGMFSWTDEIINEISDSISEQVEAVETTSQTISLIDEAMRKFDQSADPTKLNNISKRELKKLSKKNASNDSETLLGFGVGGATPSRAGTFAQGQLPAYSVEQLYIA